MRASWVRQGLPFRVDLTRSPSLRRMTGICAIRPFIGPVWKGSNGSISTRSPSRRRMAGLCAHLPLLSCLVPERSPTLATGSTHTRCGNSTPEEIMKMPLDDLRRTEHCREGTQRRQAFSQHARWSALQPLAVTRTQPIVSARRCRRRCSVQSSRWSDGRRGIGRRASRFECCARRRRDLDTAGGGPRMLAV